MCLCFSKNIFEKSFNNSKDIQVNLTNKIVGRKDDLTNKIVDGKYPRNVW